MAPQPNPDGTRKSRAEILEEVFRSHRDILRSQAHHHSVNPIDADDALGDAYLAFLRNYDGPPGDDALYWIKAWVKYSAWKIARLDRRRNARRVMARPDPETLEVPDHEIEDPRDGLAVLFERMEDVEEIAEAFSELKPDERTALVLLGLGYSYREIGEMQGWTFTKVNRCLAKGRARVRQKLLVREGERP